MKTGQPDYKHVRGTDRPIDSDFTKKIEDGLENERLQAVKKLMANKLLRAAVRKRTIAKLPEPERLPQPELSGETACATDISRAMEADREWEMEQQQKAAQEEEIARAHALDHVLEITRNLNQAHAGVPQSNPPSPLPATTPGLVSPKSQGKSRDESPVVKLRPPVMFDSAQNLLIDGDGHKTSRLPLWLTDVIRAWFKPDPMNKKAFRGQLPYAEIADLYERARIRKEVPKASEEEVLFRLAQRGVAEKPAYFAKRWATAARRELKPYGLASKVLFRCDRRSRSYPICPGWHETNPVLHRKSSKRQYEDQKNSRDSEIDDVQDDGWDDEQD